MKSTSAETVRPARKTTATSPMAANGDLVCLFRNRPVRMGFARIDHHLCPGGLIRRYVVLESQRLRDLLNKPRREEIDPLHTKDLDGLKFISDVWDRAHREAIRALKALHRRVREIEQVEESSKPARQNRKSLDIAVLEPVAHDGSDIQGVLLHAGMHANGNFAVDLYDPESMQVVRLNELDLARALDVSGVRPLESISIAATGRHEVSIHEERSGSHGQGTRTLKRGRNTFVITPQPAGTDRSDDRRLAHRTAPSDIVARRA